MTLRIGRRPWNEILFSLDEGGVGDPALLREDPGVIPGDDPRGVSNEDARVMMLRAITNLNADRSTFSYDAAAVASLGRARAAWVRVAGASGAGRPPRLEVADEIEPMP